MKRLFIAAMTAFIVLFASCKKSEPAPEINPVVTDASFDGFTIDFAPSSGVTSIEYAVCPLLSVGNNTDVAFESGAIEGWSTADPADGPVTAAVDSIGPYVVFARGVSASGLKSETKTISAMASPAGINIDGFNSIIIDADSYAFDSKYSKVGVLVASKSVLAEVAMTPEELIDVYFGAGMIPSYAIGESFAIALNGEQDYEYYVCIVTLDANGDLCDKMYFTFVSPAFDEAEQTPDKMTIEVKDITESTARIIYTMGDNTCAYYQALYKKSDYDKLRSEAEAAGEDPDKYVRDYTAFYGGLLVENEDYVWPDLTPGTDMVAVGFPMNGNGINGYGEGTIVDFKTLGASAAPAGAPASHGVVRPVTLDQIRALR